MRARWHSQETPQFLDAMSGPELATHLHMKSKSARILRLSSGVVALLAMHGLSACGDTKSVGGDGDGDGDSTSGGGPSSGGATTTGGGPSTGGAFPATGGATPAGGSGGAPTGGRNQGGEGGMGGAPEGVGGEVINGLNCPSELPAGDCELGETFTCEGFIYPFVTPTCSCIETDGYDEPQWHCAL